MTTIAAASPSSPQSPSRSRPWEGYERVLAPIELIFAAYMGLLGLLALAAWLGGDTGPAAFLAFAGFYAVNAAFSLVSRRSRRRLNLDRARIASGTLIAPAAYLLAGDPFMRWWPAFLIMCLVGTALLSLHGGGARVARPLTAYFVGLYALAESLAPAPHDWYMVAMNSGAIAFVALLFGEIVAFLGATLASEREQRAQLAAEKARTETMLRREAAEALRESEAHFRSLLENAFDITAVVDGDGNFRYVSANYERELGWTPAELIGRAFAPLVHPDDLGKLTRDLRAALAAPGQVVSGEARGRHRDGTWRWFEYLGKARPDGTFVANSRNITERKRAEEALRALNAELERRVAERTASLESALAETRRLAAIIEATSDYVGIADLRGRSVYVNRAGLRMVGLDQRRSKEGQPVAECYPASEAAKVRAMVEAAMRGEIWSGEITMRHASGREFPVSEVTFALPGPDGKPEYLATIIRDISEQKRAEERIRESEEKFRGLTELSSDWYWEQDESFRFTSFAGGGVNDTGVDQQALIGKRRWELGYGGVSEEAWARHRELHARHLPFRDFVMQRTDREGRTRYLSVSGIPILDAGGNFRGYRGVGREITARMEAEKKLERQLALFQALVDTMPAAVAFKDRDLRFLGCNRAHQEFFGPSAEELAGKTVAELEYLPREVRDKLTADDLEVLRTGRTIQSQYDLLDRHGVLRPVLHWKAPITLPDGTHIGLLGVVVDISEQHRVQEALSAERKVLQTMVEHIPLGIAVFDADNRLGVHNQHYRELLDYPDSLFEGAAPTMDDLIRYGARRGEYGEGDPEALAARVIERARSISRRRFERTRPNGLRLEVRGAPLPDGGFVGVFADVSERYQQEERLQQILEASPDPFVIVNEIGQVTYMNAQCEAQYGVARGAMHGASAMRLFPERLRAKYRSLLAEYIGNARVRRHKVVQALVGRRSDGSEFPVEATVNLIELRGAPLVLFAMRDVSVQKRLEHDLREAKLAAEASNRAKSAFLATMSHEIRTPMNAVIGMTSLLLETPLSPRQRDFVETIRSGGDSLLAVINDILDFSKIEAGKLEIVPKPLAVRESVEAVLDLLAPRADEKGLEVLCQIDENVPAAIVGDVTRLRQVLVNLVGNAIKFTERGEVAVSVSAEPLAAVGGAARRHELRFSVRDTGPGIPADKQHRLFQSFSQLDSSPTREHGGTGLGLAISRRLAQLMGGRLWVESEGVAGRGATFHFTIQAEHAEAPRRRLGVLPELRGRRLLIVDDNETNRRILALQARSWGMEPVLAATTAEALERVRSGEPLDLAVLDMHMPRPPGIDGAPEDGVALAQRICGLRGERRLPLVMLTSAGSAGRPEAEAIRCFEAWLTKPVKPSQLYDVLIAALAPGSAPEPEKPAAPAAPAPLAERMPLRILLAEDVALNQKFALLALEQMGYRADVAANGLEALAALRRQPYDVVLMDVQMPELDGIQATRRIRAGELAGPQPYIIAMTANAMQGDRESCLQAGMDDYVSKPIYLAELRAALERAVPARAGAAPVQRGAVEELLARPGGAGLMAMFSADAVRYAAELRAAVERRDAPAIARVAHDLKGSSGYFGAERLLELAARLELGARAGDIGDAAALLADTEREIERVREALGALHEGMAEEA